MPECMRCQTPAGRKTKARSFNQPLHIARIQTAPAEADKNRSVAIGTRASQAETVALSEVCRQSPSSIFAERNDPLFFALPQDSDQLLAEVDIFIVQTHQFTNAQPAGIQQFENRSIPQILHGLTLREFDHCSCLFLAEAGGQLLR